MGWLSGILGKGQKSVSLPQVGPRIPEESTVIGTRDFGELTRFTGTPPQVLIAGSSLYTHPRVCGGLVELKGIDLARGRRVVNHLLNALETVSDPDFKKLRMGIVRVGLLRHVALSQNEAITEWTVTYMGCPHIESMLGNAGVALATALRHPEYGISNIPKSAMKVEGKGGGPVHTWMPKDLDWSDESLQGCLEFDQMSGISPPQTKEQFVDFRIRHGLTGGC